METNSSGIIYKLILLLFIIAELCFMVSVNRSTAVGILIFLILWVIKDIYEDARYITETGTSGNFSNGSRHGNDYWEHRFVSNRSANATTYKPTSASTTWKPYAEVEKDIIKMIKPSMSVAFDTDEKTEMINKKKEEYYKKILEVGTAMERPKPPTPKVIEQTKEPIALLPSVTTANNLTNPSFNIEKIINVTNTAKVDGKMKEVYDAIIAYLSQRLIMPYTIHNILHTIKYVDVIPEIETAIIYVSDKSSWGKYNTSTDDLANYLKKAMNFKEVTIEDFLIKSIVKYYSEQQENKIVTVIPTTNSFKENNSLAVKAF